MAFAGTFLFRFVTAQFINDHFVHLSRAQQILLGDVPIRDFFDPGLLLSYYASAAALILSGHTLLGEAILTVGCVALAAALTFALSARSSGSYLLGVAATVLAVLSVPRLYNYPKVIFYVLALWLSWRYANRPGGLRLAALAVTTAVAFLFRHDHGVYIGVPVAMLMVLLSWDQPRRGLKNLVAYAAVTAALLLPFGLCSF